MVPISLEEEIVSYADKFYSKTPEYFNKEKSIEEIKQKLLKFGKYKVRQVLRA